MDSSTPTREAYSPMGHLALNVTRPVTEWLNMGYWREFGSQDFPEACHGEHLLIRSSATSP